MEYILSFVVLKTISFLNFTFVAYEVCLESKGILYIDNKRSNIMLVKPFCSGSSNSYDDDDTATATAADSDDDRNCDNNESISRVLIVILSF